VIHGSQRLFSILAYGGDGIMWEGCASLCMLRKIDQEGLGALTLGKGLRYEGEWGKVGNLSNR